MTARPKIVTDIVKGYKESKRKPIRGKWFGKHREVCPLCMWALTQGVKPNKKFIDAIVHISLGKCYVEGFNDQWEGKSSQYLIMYESQGTLELYERGRKHAKQVEKLLKKEGLIK